jgi:Opioid growth factor receptor (OGFr) conserved region
MSFFSRRAAGAPSAFSLVSFYEGTGRDHRGRRLSEILQWGVDRLESSHDYIQTLFPLPEESGVNWSAPVIDRKVFDAFRSRPELRGRLRDSFEKILWFYGFKLDRQSGEVKVSVSRP